MRLEICYGQFGALPFGIFPQIWIQDTLRHIPGPIMANFDICPFLTAPGQSEYFSENGCLQKIKDILKLLCWDLHIWNWPKMGR